MEQKFSPSQLQFQSFTPDNPSDSELTGTSVHTLTFNHEPDTPGLTETQTNESFWTFEYYQQFFDVDTDQVKKRIIWGMFPRPGVSYLQHCIKPNPDLYGPFWICVTLIFTIAVSGNVANYLQFAPEGNFRWKYDFHLVSYAATAIFIYAWLVPLGLWGTLKWQNSLQGNINFLELLCVYGYSLGIYIPVSILWVIQISWFQWLLVLVGATFSGYVLLTTISPACEGNKKYIILAIVIGFHFLLAVGFMLYFFHVPSIPAVNSLESTIPSSSHVVVKQNHTNVIPAKVQ